MWLIVAAGLVAATLALALWQAHRCISAAERNLRDVSHEMRGPLTRIQLALEAARAGEPTALDDIANAADRLAALAGDVLTTARPVRHEPVALDCLVISVLEACAPEARAQGCRFAADVEPDLALRGDAELLRRAIENVVRNAIRHAPAGSSIEIAARRDEAAIVVTVRDHGQGVEQSRLERIFHPFVTHSHGGAGLGLAIARHAATVHRGTVTALNTHPGLAVEIRLP
jgi:two-component system sensor histidine kinase CpxA